MLTQNFLLIVFLFAFFLFRLGCILNIVNFLKFKDLSKRKTSHICIVGSFMIMTKHLSAHIINKTSIKLKLKIFEFFIILWFLKYIAQWCFIKCHWFKSKYFRIICVREFWIPFLNKLWVCWWKSCYKLVVNIQPVVHWIVSNKRLFAIDYFLNY